ncbi:MAG: SMC-Scp complex subunit ScpB [Candidatus Woesearchaeota archaeon]
MSDWKKVEAVLFASGSYVEVITICELTGLSKKNAQKALADLKNHYDKLDSSLEVFSDGDSWKLNVKTEYSDLVQKVVSGVEMPYPVMETLALIAYKSPVMQSEIVNTRGTVAYDHISYLEQKKFITRERYGRTYKLKVTEKFHDYFDVDDSKIQSLFEDIEKPVIEEVVEIKEENDEAFEEKIIDRMKKQVPAESSEDVEKFLDDFENRLVGVKGRIDHAEEEIEELKPKEEAVLDEEEVDLAFEEEKN